VNYSLLFNNQRKRLEQPWWMLIFFAMFCFWQMGFIYFIGPSLTIDGRTPLPISTDNTTVLIALAYVVSILWMMFLPRTVVWGERVLTIISLTTLLGLFLPLPDDGLRMLIYIHTFSCCVMIGFESFIIINYFTEHSTIKHLTLAYGVALVLITVVQNDFIPLTFSAFRFLLIIALTALLVFFFKMPAGKDACPQYIRKKDNITSPKKLLTGTYVLVFIGSLMGVSGPAISGEVQHGIFITYLANAIGSLLIYLMYKKATIHPFRSISICMGVGCIGFLLMFVSHYIVVLSYISCAFIGIGMLSCQMLPLYGVVLNKTYPSRFITPIIIGEALVAVLIQGVMVEMFRTAPELLNLAYGTIMVILVILFLQIEPYFLYIMGRKISEFKEEGEPELMVEMPAKTVEDDNIVNETTFEGAILINQLTKREREVLELISCGYSNADIAKILVISSHTVNDYTKKIYRKLDVHSRNAATQIMLRYEATKQ